MTNVIRNNSAFKILSIQIFKFAFQREEERAKRRELAKERKQSAEDQKLLQEIQVC
jgi:hypothetical protein